MHVTSWRRGETGWPQQDDPRGTCFSPCRGCVVLDLQEQAPTTVSVDPGFAASQVPGKGMAALGRCLLGGAAVSDPGRWA